MTPAGRPGRSVANDQTTATEPNAGSGGPAGPTADSERQFRRDVLPDELAYVQNRRASRNLDGRALDPAAGAGNDLAGLALSGGGIRSATFNLGLMQALDRHGLFPHLDYLSTASGGGFIGSSLTALMSERARKAEEGRAPAEGRAPFPFPHSEGAAEADSVRYLRGHSDYLAPSGLVDYLRAFALLARGIALNLALLLPVLLMLGLAGLVLSARDLKAAARAEAWVEALARDLESTADRRSLLTGSTGPYLLAERDVLAALDTAPSLVAQPASLDELRLAEGASWRRVAERLAAVVAEQEPVVLDSRPLQVVKAAGAIGGGERLIYGPAAGLQLDVPRLPLASMVWAAIRGRDPRGHSRYELWTEGSPIAVAAFSPDGGKIAAAGFDGSLWLFYPDDPDRPQSGLQRSSGELERAGARFTRLAFSKDGSRLFGMTVDGSVETWVFPGAEPETRLQLHPSRTQRNPDGDTAWAFLQPLMAHGGAGAAPVRPDSPEAVGRPIGAPWSPHRFSLPRTGWTLVWTALLFIGLYPFALLLAGPLERGASGLAELRRRAARAVRRLARLKAGRPDKAPAAPGRRGVTIAWRIAASVLVGPPLFAGSLLLFEAMSPFEQQNYWPWLGFVWVAVWLLLSVVFLAPPLRRWRPEAAPAEADAAESDSARAPRSGRRGAVAALLLLSPWLLLAAVGGCVGALIDSSGKAVAEPTASAVQSEADGGAGEAPGGADAPVSEPGGLDWLVPPAPDAPARVSRLLLRPWLLVLVWWLACLALLAPLILSPQDQGTQAPEQALERHRRLTWRIYAAAHLLLWAYLFFGAFHPVPRSMIEMLLRAVVGGADVGEGTLTALAPWAILAYLAGIQYLIWRLFARLAGAGTGTASPAVGDDAPDAEGGALPSAAGSSLRWRERYEKAFSFALLLLAAVAFFEIQPYLVHHYHAFSDRHSVEWLYFLAVASFLAIVLAGMFLQAVKGVGQKLVLAALGVLGPLLPFLVYLSLVDAFVYGPSWLNLRWLLFGPIPPIVEGVRLSFLLVTVAVVAYLLGKLVDANATGMHGFYRDRLSQGYLVGKDRDGVLGPEDRLDLSEVCLPGTGAPYHLLNASLNMQRESAGAQRWRNSDFFVFSPRWCGGPHSGYCRTGELEYLAPDVHLGSAMAVSGAAAAPNMGSLTSPFLVMLMTLLNVRLGLWLPTPRRVRRLAQLGLVPTTETPGGVRTDSLADRLRRWWMRLRNRPSGYALVQEMTSRLDAGGPYVNLSDGGHLENTGAYELLRRQCRFIVIGDGESDPEVQFGSLAALMRFAAIDLGIEIDIDLGPLRTRADGTSPGHFAVGTIRYPAPRGGGERQTGRLLYVKTSVDGRESEIIREYRARNPDFPHESTADQVFEEDQFEAYRALGFHIGSELFADYQGRPFATADHIERWLAQLAAKQEGVAAPAAGDRVT